VGLEEDQRLDGEVRLVLKLVLRWLTGDYLDPTTRQGSRSMCLGVSPISYTLSGYSETGEVDFKQPWSDLNSYPLIGSYQGKTQPVEKIEPAILVSQTRSFTDRATLIPNRAYLV